jgi:HK97 family phage major capsid protein
MSEYDNKTVEEIAQETKDFLDSKFNEHRVRIEEIEQKVARKPGAAFDLPPSIGQQFVESEKAKSFIDDTIPGNRVRVEVKTVATITGASGSGGDLYVPYRDAPAMLPQRPLRVRDLLPVVQVSTGTVEYPQQTTRNISAATVAEGALKPQSDIQFDLVTVPIRTIAHWALASKQILDDVPQLRSYIDNDLIYGLGFVEDNQLLNGAGTGTDLNGIYTQATAFAAGSLVVASPTKLDVLEAAILQNNLANLPADGIVVHPSDWASILMTKDSQGRYVFGDPQTVAQPRLWSVPIVASQAMTSGAFLVGNFRGSATLYSRQDMTVELSSEDSDNFRRNLISVRVEERIGLAVRQPTGFTKGTFSAAVTDLTS